MSLYPALAAQWDVRKNAPRKPSEFSAGSHRLVWWRCEKGHSWRAQIKSRVSGCSCPVCAGKHAVAGENSLADVAPELIAQWDTEKNAPLTPQQVTCGTRRKVWWRCEKGHSWKSSIASRVYQKAGCPVCRGKVVTKGFNDLATLYPALAKEWDMEKNGALSPETVTAASNRKAWWRCPLGHSYQAGHRLADCAERRLSLLCGQKGARGFQRPCDDFAADRRTVAPNAQRCADTGNGHGRQPLQGVVAVSCGPCVEGGRLLTDGRESSGRLSRLCGTVRWIPQSPL